MAEAGRATVKFVGDYSSLNAGLASALAPSKMGKMGKLGGLAVGGALAAALGGAAVTKALYDLGSDFDKAFDKIRVGTGKTGKQLEGLERDFKAVYKTVPSGMDEVADSIAGLNKRLGLTGRPLQKMARNVSELSRITDTDLQDNIKNISRAFVDWEVPVKNQVKTLDGFFRLSQKSGAAVSDLASDVQKFGSPLRTLGFDLGEAASMFATFERAGVNSQTMVPGFKLAIGNLVKPTNDLKKTLSDLGVAAGNPEKAIKQVLGLLGNQSELSKVQKMSLAMDVFGKRAGADLAEAVKQGRFNLQGYMREFRSGGDTIRKSAKETNDAGENFAIFGHKIQTALEPVASLVHDTFSDFSRVLANLKINKAIKDVERFTKTNKDFKSVLNAVKTVLRTFGDVARVVFQIVREQIKGFWQYTKGVFQALRGVVKVVSGVLKGDWRKAWNGVKDIFRGGAKVVLGVMKAMTAPVRSVVGRVGKAMSGGFRSIWGTVKGVFEDGKDAVIGVINDIISVLEKIPGVDIDPISTSSGTGYRAGRPLRKQRGGDIRGGKPSGDSVPALLERGEYVLNREAVRAVGVGRLDDLNFKQHKRFQTGGPVGMILGGAWDSVKDLGAAALESASDTAAGKIITQKAPQFFIDQLPAPNIPEPFTDVGPYMIDRVSQWMRDHIEKRAVSGGNIVEVGKSLQRLGYEVGEHPAFGGVGGGHSRTGYHYKARAIDVNDDANPRGGSEMASLDWLYPQLKKLPHAELLWRVADHYDHLHFAMQNGGMVEHMARGGSPGKYKHNTKPRTLNRIKRKANEIADSFTGYVWGGGHAEGNNVTSNGLDCSGAVAKLVQQSGWDFPVAHSSVYANRFKRGHGKDFTLWSNNDHTFAEIDGRMWGTNSSNGLGYHSHTTSGFAPSHPKLASGGGSVRRPQRLRSFGRGDIPGGDRVMPGYQVAQAMYAGGFRQPDLTTAVAVAGPESGWNPSVNAAGSEDSRGLLQINVGPGANPQYASKDLYDPVTNARVAHRVMKDNGGWSPWTGYTSGGYRGWLGRAKEAIEDAKRRGLKGVVVGGGIDREASRREERTAALDRLARRVAGAKTGRGRQSALWEMIQGWGQYGEFDKGEKKSIIDRVRAAAGTLAPLGNLPALKNISSFMSRRGEVSGEEELDGGFVERLKDIIENRGDAAEKKRKLVFSRIEDRGAFYPLKGALKDNDNLLARYAEEESIADTLATSEGGPGGSDYTDAEVQKLIYWNRNILDVQKSRRTHIHSSIGHLRKVAGGYRTLMDAVIEGKDKKKPWWKKKTLMTVSHYRPGEWMKKNAWKFPAWKTGIKKAQQTIGDKYAGTGLVGNLAELVGLTGRGGTMLETKQRLASLGATETVEKAGALAGSAGISIADVLQIRDADKYGVFNRIPKGLQTFHTGGTVQGAGHEEVMALVKARESVYTEQQNNRVAGALASPAPVIQLVIEDGAVNEDRIKLVADGQIMRFDRVKDQKAKAGIR